MRYLALLTALLIATSASAEMGRKHVKSLSFEDCNKRIRAMATRFAIAPVNIMETNSMRVVRFPVSDGSVLVTCGGSKLTVAQSSRRCGVDVRC